MVILGISPMESLISESDPDFHSQRADISRRQSIMVDGTTRVFSMPFGDGKISCGNYHIPAGVGGVDLAVPACFHMGLL